MARMFKGIQFGLITVAMTIGGFADGSTAQVQNNYQGPLGPPENNWSRTANWTEGESPNDTHHVVIPYAATTVMDLPYTSDFGTKILSLSVAGGGTVDLEL